MKKLISLLGSMLIAGAALAADLDVIPFVLTVTTNLTTRTNIATVAHCYGNVSGVQVAVNDEGGATGAVTVVAVQNGVTIPLYSNSVQNADGLYLTRIGATTAGSTSPVSSTAWQMIPLVNATITATAKWGIDHGTASVFKIYTILEK